MGRGDYIHTVAELFGVGDSTVCNIVLEVPKLKIEVTWDVAVHFPTTERDYINLMNWFEKLWQFPYCFGAVGGQESTNENRNFKNFYSIVLMAIVDSKYRFIWANCGIFQNSHDSAIFQAS